MSIIKRQTILSTIYSYLGVLVGIITQGFLIPKYFTTQENGLLAILLAWMYIICQIASLGFNHAGTKYFSIFRNNENKHNGYLNLGLKLNGFGFLLCVLLLYLFKNQIISGEFLSKSDNAIFKEYYFVLIPISLGTILFNLFDNYAKGLYNTVAGSFYAQFLQRFLLLLAVILYSFKWVTFAQFMGLWTFAIVFPTFLMLFTAVKIGNFSLKKSTFFNSSALKNQFYQFAMFSAFTGLSSIVILQLDKIMINEYLGLSKTGIYNTCLLFASLLGMSYIAVLKASSALVITALDELDYPKVASIYKKSSINLYVFGLLLMLVVWLNIDFLFDFIKPEYSIGKVALVLIGFSKLYDLLHGINGLILSNSKYFKLDSVILISFILVLYVLNRLLIPAYGLNGAAFSALCSVVYYNSIRTFLVWKFYKIHPFGWQQLASTLIFICIFLALNHFPSFDNQYLMAFAKTILSTVLFCGLIYGFKISEDVNKIVAQLKARIF